MSTAGSRANEALERGIELYGKGELDAALGEWERALALDPDLAQAQEYASYVRDNYDALRAQLEGASLAEGTGVDELEATEFAPPRPDPEDEFVKVDSGELPLIAVDASTGGLAAGGATADDFDLELQGSAASPAPAPPDDDWSNLLGAGAPAEADPEPTPAPDVPPSTPAARALTVPATPSSRATMMFGSSEHPIPPAPPSGPAFAVPGPSGHRASDGDEDELTVALDLGLDGPPPVDSSLDLDDRSFDLALESELLPTPPASARHAGPPAARSTGTSRPGLDEGLLAAYDDAFDEAGADLGLGPDKLESVPPAYPEPPRRAPSATQVGNLISLAQEARTRGDDPSAAQAAILALEIGRAMPGGLDEPSAGRLLEIFIGILGEMERTPLVAVPMHELTRGGLDHRTGFLLSRIDGMLTLEDILDVSGMPRLDAAHLLVSLLQRGYIELR